MNHATPYSGDVLANAASALADFAEGAEAERGNNGLFFESVTNTNEYIAVGDSDDGSGSEETDSEGQYSASETDSGSSHAHSPHDGESSSQHSHAAREPVRARCATDGHHSGSTFIHAHASSEPHYSRELSEAALTLSRTATTDMDAPSLIRTSVESRGPPGGLPRVASDDPRLLPFEDDSGTGCGEADDRDYAWLSHPENGRVTLVSAGRFPQSGTSAAHASHLSHTWVAPAPTRRGLHIAATRARGSRRQAVASDADGSPLDDAAELCIEDPFPRSGGGRGEQSGGPRSSRVRGRGARSSHSRGARSSRLGGDERREESATEPETPLGSDADASPAMAPGAGSERAVTHHRAAGLVQQPPRVRSVVGARQGGTGAAAAPASSSPMDANPRERAMRLADWARQAGSGGPRAPLPAPRAPPAAAPRPQLSRAPGRKRRRQQTSPLLPAPSAAAAAAVATAADGEAELALEAVMPSAARSSAGAAATDRAGGEGEGQPSAPLTAHPQAPLAFAHRPEPLPPAPPALQPSEGSPEDAAPLPLGAQPTADARAARGGPLRSRPGGLRPVSRAPLALESLVNEEEGGSADDLDEYAPSPLPGGPARPPAAKHRESRGDRGHVAVHAPGPASLHAQKRPWGPAEDDALREALASVTAAGGGGGGDATGERGALAGARVRPCLKRTMPLQTMQMRRLAQQTPRLLQPSPGIASLWRSSL